VAVAGKRASRCFNSKAEATLWTIAQEDALGADRLPEHSLLDTIERFAREVSPLHETDWEKYRLNSFKKLPITTRMLATLKPEDCAQWRDARLKQVLHGVTPVMVDGKHEKGLKSPNIASTIFAWNTDLTRPKTRSTAVSTASRWARRHGRVPCDLC